MYVCGKTIIVKRNSKETERCSLYMTFFCPIRHQCLPLRSYSAEFVQNLLGNVTKELEKTTELFDPSINDIN